MGSLRMAVSLVCVAALALCVAAAAMGAVEDEEPLAARSAGETTDPVAVIEPLPDLVSNGTRYYLDGLSSYDLDDDLVNVTTTITNYTWELTHENETSYVYGFRERHAFTDLGLYEIKLTVRDSWGNTGVDFTAVMSVDDLDCDSMPDWWEMYYLGTIDADPDADFDSDGCTNIQEWFAGTLPNDADPPPDGGGFLEENWMYLLAAVAVAAAVLLLMHPGMKRKRSAREAEKIKIALELEKSIEEE